MTKTKIILSTTAAVVTAFSAFVYYEGPLYALEERFPEIDHKILRKAHLEMWWEAFTGKYEKYGKGGTPSNILDDILLEKVSKLTKQ